MNVLNKNVLRFGLLSSIILCLVLGSVMTTVSAHSPQSMQVKYSMETKTLAVDITHQVSNLNSHYVNNILVTINGDTVIDEDYTSQPDSNYALSFENVSADVDDNIVVLASCNQGGSIMEELTVSEGTSQTGSDSTPGFEFVFFICSLILLFGFYKRRM